MIVKDTNGSLHLTPALAGVRMTLDEFDAADECDELYRYELVHGVLVVTPPPSEGERGPNEELGFLLKLYKKDHPQGSALDLTLPESQVRTGDSCRRADRPIWAGLGRVPRVRHDVPTIVVEFVSAGKRDFQRDYVDKRDEYLAIGVQEYWIIDRFRRLMTVIQRVGENVVETEIPAHQTHTSPLLPGFELPLEKLFQVADTLEDANSRDPDR